MSTNRTLIAKSTNVTEDLSKHQEIQFSMQSLSTAIVSLDGGAHSDVTKRDETTKLEAPDAKNKQGPGAQARAGAGGVDDGAINPVLVTADVMKQYHTLANKLFLHRKHAKDWTLADFNTGSLIIPNIREIQALNESIHGEFRINLVGPVKGFFTTVQRNGSVKIATDIGDRALLLLLQCLDLRVRKSLVSSNETDLTLTSRLLITMIDLPGVILTYKYVEKFLKYSQQDRKNVDLGTRSTTASPNQKRVLTPPIAADLATFVQRAEKILYHFIMITRWVLDRECLNADLESDDQISDRILWLLRKDFAWTKIVNTFMKDFTTYITQLNSFTRSQFKNFVNFYRNRRIAWPHSQRLLRDIELAGFVFSPTPDKHDRTVCHSCGAEVSVWQVWHNPWLFHHWNKNHPFLPPRNTLNVTDRVKQWLISQASPAMPGRFKVSGEMTDPDAPKAQPSPSEYVTSLEGEFLGADIKFSSQKIMECLIHNGSLSEVVQLEKKHNYLTLPYTTFAKLTQQLSAKNPQDLATQQQLAQLLWQNSPLELGYKQKLAKMQKAQNKQENIPPTLENESVSVTPPVEIAPLKTKVKRQASREKKSEVKKREIEEKLQQRKIERERAAAQAARLKQKEEEKKKQHQEEWKKTLVERKVEQQKLEQQQQQDLARKAELLKQKALENEAARDQAQKREERNGQLKKYSESITGYMRAIGTYGVFDTKDTKNDYYHLNLQIKHFALMYNLARCYLAISRFKNITHARNDHLADEATNMRNMIMHGVTETEANREKILHTMQNLREVLPTTLAKLNKSGPPSARLFKKEVQPISDLFGKEGTEIRLTSLEDNPQYKELAAFFADLKTNDLGANTAIEDEKYFVWVRNKMIPLINSIMSPILKLPLEVLMKDEATVRSRYGEHLDALKMLFSMTGEYFNRERRERLRNSLRMSKEGKNQILQYLSECHDLRNQVGHDFPDVNDRVVISLGEMAARINPVLLPIPCDPRFSVSLRNNAVEQLTAGGARVGQ